MSNVLFSLDYICLKVQERNKNVNMPNSCEGVNASKLFYSKQGYIILRDIYIMAIQAVNTK